MIGPSNEHVLGHGALYTPLPPAPSLPSGVHLIRRFPPYPKTNTSGREREANRSYHSTAVVAKHITTNRFVSTLFYAFASGSNYKNICTIDDTNKHTYILC